MRATSPAVEYISLSNSSMSSPWGFANRECSMPSSAALAFMASTKASLADWPSRASPAPTASAMAMAASLPEGTMSPVRAAWRVSVSPAWRFAEDSPTAAASGDTVTFVSRGNPESRATMAVITLVMEAMWDWVSASRAKSTAPFSSVSTA